MTIKSSGPLTFTEIHDEFKPLGGTLNQTPYQLSEYRTLPPGIGLPQSGTIKFSDFYGKSGIRFVTEDQWIPISETQINSKYNIKECNLWDALFAMGYRDEGGFYDITLPADYWLWSDDTSKGGLIIPDTMTGNIIFRNKGIIIGKGGRGGGGTINAGQVTNGGAGGPAIKIGNVSPITFINETNAYVAAGGGGGSSGGGELGAGGGGGAGGGAGGTGYRAAGNPGAGGALNTKGADAPDDSDAGGGKGGGAGAGGGGWDNGSGKGNKVDSGSGGGGGRVLPGDGGAGGGGSRDTTGRVGGAANNAGGGGGTGHGAGGGGWGASGGNCGGDGGAGGLAFEITTDNGQVSVTNNGTVWGRD